ncbi:hypothetical protein [Arthrobacter sp. TWP1-1]|uniref:hypothetical protein n=1 Tax=Arthrobacter sp. TWP1-1 TaxID=2804568 RepID=UPI003CF73C0A
MTEQHTPSTQAATASTGAALSNAAVGPLTIRDLAVLGSVLIIFVASVVPIVQTLAGGLNLWNTGGLFYLAIGVILPLVVGGLFLARRLSPGTQVRIGSLSTDQFASVVASFATFFFFTGTVTNFGIAYLVGLIGSLLLLASTACAQWIPALASDFAGRTEVPANLVARDAVPAVKRPSAPKPVAGHAGAKPAGPQGSSGKGASVASGSQGVGVPTPGADAAVAGAPVAGAGASAAWGTPKSSVAHTSAGQIFTPAKDASPAAQTASTVSGAVARPAASNTQTFPVTGIASENSEGLSAPSAPEVSDDAAAPSSTRTEAAQPAEATAAVVPSDDDSSADDNATTLNPQVAPAAEQEKAEPAAAEPAEAEPVKESIGATVNPQAAATVSTEPFWFAVDRPQNVIDEHTRQFMFKLTPGAWILGLEDRGNSFLVQDSHGKTGVLLDLVGIERASDSQ